MNNRMKNRNKRIKISIDDVYGIFQVKKVNSKSDIKEAARKVSIKKHIVV